MAFFATSHGKGPCNGAGGLLKRMATKASLQRPYQDQIKTPHKLYEFAKQNVPSLNVEYFTVGDWAAEGNCLRAALQRCGQCQGPDSCITPVLCHCSK